MTKEVKYIIVVGKCEVVDMAEKPWYDVHLIKQSSQVT